MVVINKIAFGILAAALAYPQPTFVGRSFDRVLLLETKGETSASVSLGDIDGDGDHDMDDHEAEKDGPEGEEPEEKKKDEEFGNSVAGSPGSDYKDVDYMVNKLAGGMNGPKKSFSGKAYRGDNPMAAGAYESRDALRASIRSELQQRLAEAKGAK